MIELNAFNTSVYNRGGEMRGRKTGEIFEERGDELQGEMEREMGGQERTVGQR